MAARGSLGSPASSSSNRELGRSSSPPTRPSASQSPQTLRRSGSPVPDEPPIWMLGASAEPELFRKLSEHEDERRDRSRSRSRSRDHSRSRSRSRAMGSGNPGGAPSATVASPASWLPVDSAQVDLLRSTVERRMLSPSRSGAARSTSAVASNRSRQGARTQRRANNDRMTFARSLFASKARRSQDSDAARLWASLSADEADSEDEVNFLQPEWKGVFQEMGTHFWTGRNLDGEEKAKAKALAAARLARRHKRRQRRESQRASKMQALGLQVGVFHRDIRLDENDAADSEEKSSVTAAVAAHNLTSDRLTEDGMESDTSMTDAQLWGRARKHKQYSDSIFEAYVRIEPHIRSALRGVVARPTILCRLKVMEQLVVAYKTLPAGGEITTVSLSDSETREVKKYYRGEDLEWTDPDYLGVQIIDPNSIRSLRHLPSHSLPLAVLVDDPFSRLLLHGVCQFHSMASRSEETQEYGRITLIRRITRRSRSDRTRGRRGKSSALSGSAAASLEPSLCAHLRFTAILEREEKERLSRTALASLSRSLSLRSQQMPVVGSSLLTEQHLIREELETDL